MADCPKSLVHLYLVGNYEKWTRFIRQTALLHTYLSFNSWLFPPAAPSTGLTTALTVLPTGYYLMTAATRLQRADTGPRVSPRTFVLDQSLLFTAPQVGIIRSNDFTDRSFFLKIMISTI